MFLASRWVLLRSLSQAGQRQQQHQRQQQQQQQQQQHGQLETFLESELKGVIAKICPLIRLKSLKSHFVLKFGHFKNQRVCHTIHEDSIIFKK